MRHLCQFFVVLLQRHSEMSGAVLLRMQLNN